MAPAKPPGRRGKFSESAEALRARLVERGVYIEAGPSSAAVAAKPKVQAAPSRGPVQPALRRDEAAHIAAGGQGGPDLEDALPDEAAGGAATFDAAAWAETDDAANAGDADGQAPEAEDDTEPAGAAAGTTAGAAEDIASVAGAAAVPMAGTAVLGPITASVTLTSEEEEALLADTVGEQPPEDPRAVAVWEVRRELDAFERSVHEQRQSIQGRLTAAEEELRAQRRAERVADYARLGLTLSRAGLGWEAAAVLRDVPAADLLALVHTLAERGLSVRDLLSRVPPAER